MTSIPMRTARTGDAPRRVTAQLQWSMSLRPAVASIAMMARTAGWLLITGGVLALVSLGLSEAHEDHQSFLLALPIAALTLGGLTVRYGRSFPRWTYQVLVASATGLITAMVCLSGGGPTSVGFGGLYVLVGLDCFFFFAWPVAIAHLALLELCSLLAFRIVDVAFAAVVVQQGSAIAVAIVVGLLARAAAAAELDTLTGLINARGFERVVREASVAAERLEEPFSVVTIDLDHFKSINETGGRVTGDRILRHLAQTWSAVLDDGQTLARAAGDEFAIVLPNYSIDRAAALADRMRAAVSEHVPCSAGVAEWRAGDSPSMVVSRSDIALFEAKNTGRGRTAQYGIESSDPTEIHLGLTDAQFRVFYQPIVDLATNQICGEEALVRWEHPTRGFVQPDDFIPEAERTGAIHALGTWVLHEACAHAASHARTTGVLRDIAVNVSGRELRRPNYAMAVAAAIHDADLNPRALTIEITESTLDADDPKVLATLQQVRGLGVSIAIDDFGTGYSNLTRLSRLPIDILKIDKSFVDDIPADGSGAPILQAIVALAQALHLQTVAEGIETAQQALILRDIGCTYAQGYYYGRPCPAADDDLKVPTPLSK